MKAKVSLKTVIVSALLLVCGLNASADNKSNLIYNSEEVNGMKVAETVYKMDGNTLANYMKYNYKYDDQNRMTESEALKWNTSTGAHGTGALGDPVRQLRGPGKAGMDQKYLRTR